MSGVVLVLNSGSSSIKYQLVEPVAGTAVASGLVERIGEPDGRATYSFGDKRFEHCGPIVDHADGLLLAYQMFTDYGQTSRRRGSKPSVTGSCTAGSCFISRH